jgi:C4-dicarboxylate transporter, DctM subunit
MISGDFVAVAGFVTLFALIGLRVPIGIAMGLVGVFGFAAIRGINPAMNLLAISPIRVITDYNLSLVPLFILMGVFAANSGLSRELFRVGNAWLGPFRGGVALSTIAACAGSRPSAAVRWRRPPPCPRWPCPRCGALATATAPRRA